MTRAMVLMCLTIALTASLPIRAADAGQGAAASARRDYIVVFDDAGEKEFNARAHGGEEKQRWHNRVVVTLPVAAADALARQRKVRYIQRLLTADEVEARLDLSRSAAADEMPEGRAVASTGSAERVIGSASTTALVLGPYAYDGSGNITSIGSNETYRYDRLGRLATAAITVGGVPHTESYTYDRWGNLTARTRDGQTTSFPTDSLKNRLAPASGATYDRAGFQTRWGSAQYAFDAAGLLRQLDDTNVRYSYAYTAGDERILARQEGGRWIWSIRDLDGKVLRQYWSWEVSGWTDPYLEWIEDYVWADGRLIGTEREAKEGGRRHVHTDHLGTPRLITDSTGAVVSEYHYYPFGVEITSMRQDRARGYERESQMDFTGHERDFNAGTTIENESYLDYMHARYYSGVTGRFLSTDPVLDIKAATHNPQRWNRYSYVSNNPINKTDPDGREEMFYMEQLFREQQMVGDGRMTEGQYWARRQSEGVGALIGAAGAGLFAAAAYLLPAATTAVLTPSTNVAITTAVGAVAGVESGFLGGRPAVQAGGVRFTQFYLNKLMSTGRGSAPEVAGAILKAGAKEFEPIAVSVGRRPGEAFSLRRATVNGKLWEMVFNTKTKEVYHIQPVKDPEKIITTWR